jgi:hypothetical protein
MNESTEALKARREHVRRSLYSDRIPDDLPTDIDQRLEMMRELDEQIASRLSIGYVREDGAVVVDGLSISVAAAIAAASDAYGVAPSPMTEAQLRERIATLQAEATAAGFTLLASYARPDGGIAGVEEKKNG